MTRTKCCLFVSIHSTALAWQAHQRFHSILPGKGLRKSTPSTLTWKAGARGTLIEGNDAAPIHIVDRTVPIDSDWNVTVWEVAKVATVVESYWENVAERESESTSGTSVPTQLDPFGLVCWPGSVVAAQELRLHSYAVKDKRVLIVGAGVGIEALAAAQLGAAIVLATDIHPLTLGLLRHGAEQMGLANIISTAEFDINSDEAVPSCDLMVVADVLYNDKLAAQVARRCLEARGLPKPPMILVTDSQRFVSDFERDIKDKILSIGQPPVSWVNRTLPSFRGSGVIIDDDQTYDVRARIMWIGLQEDSNVVERN